jgi:hypothetical protein
VAGGRGWDGSRGRVYRAGPAAATPRRTAAAYDGRVSEPGSPPPPSSPPGERRLAHPPSDRYRAAEARTEAARAAPDPAASVVRGVALAVVVAVVGALAIVVLGGILTLTAGLVVVAGATGWGIAAALRFGAGERLPPGRRVRGAIVLAIATVLAGQLGLWQYARIEGGVLPPLDYLAEVFGPLVPAQVLVAVVAAWLAAR